MKNSLKRIRFIILVVIIFTVTLTSCGEKGGVIIVENKRMYVERFVHISDTNGYTVVGTVGQWEIYPDKTHKYKIDEDGIYWVNINGIRYKEVFVSGGEEIYVTIE